MTVLDLFYNDYRQSFLKRLAADVVGPTFEFKPYERRPKNLSEDALRSLYFNTPEAPNNVTEIYNKLTYLQDELDAIDIEVDKIKAIADEQVYSMRQQMGAGSKYTELQSLMKQLAIVSGLANKTGNVVYRLGQKLGGISRTQEQEFALSSQEKLNYGTAFLHQWPDILQKLNEHLTQVEEGRRASAMILDKIRVTTVRGPKTAQLNEIDPIGRLINQLQEMLTYYTDVLVSVEQPLAAAAKKEN